LALKENDVLAVLGAGAYGFVMSSNYNSRGRAAEVMVNGDQAHLIRERETIESFGKKNVYCLRSKKSCLEFTKCMAWAMILWWLI
jgi:glycerol-3-phosphate dehydrogenase